MLYSHFVVSYSGTKVDSLVFMGKTSIRFKNKTLECLHRKWQMPAKSLSSPKIRARREPSVYEEIGYLENISVLSDMN